MNDLLFRLFTMIFLLVCLSSASLAQPAPPAPKAGKNESVATVRLPKTLVIRRTRLTSWEIVAIKLALPNFSGEDFRVSRFDLNGDRRLELVVQPLSTCRSKAALCSLFIISRNSSTWRNIMPGGDALSVDRLTIQSTVGAAGFRSFLVGTGVGFSYGGDLEDGYYVAPSFR